MRSVLVVVLDVLGQDRLQVPPIHDQLPVQALAADMDTPAFAPSIAFGARSGVRMMSRHFGSKDGIEGGWEVAVAIVDKIRRHLSSRGA